VNPTQVLSAAPARPEKGKRKTVFITVDFDGVCEQDEDDIGKYRFTFAGNGVDAASGQVVCLGEAGHVPEKQYVMRFVLLPGDSIDDVTFQTPNTSGDFEFKAGVGACGELLDGSEFDRARMKRNGTRIVVRNMKKNSGIELGYQFVVWVTHLVNGHVKGVPCDPRIINR
jgi:hypothetical protein